MDYSTLATVWAKIEERRGTEGESGDQLVATRLVDFIIRYKSGLDERMRITYGGNTYLIQSIIKEDARKSFMRITTKLKD